MTDKIKGGVRSHTNKLISLYRLLDTFIIAVTLVMILHINLQEWSANQTSWLLSVVICYHFFAELADIYRFRRGLTMLQEIGGITSAWFFGIVVLVLADYFYPLMGDGYQHTFWYWVSLVPLELLSWHTIVRTIVNRARAAGHNNRNVALVGVTQLAREMEAIFLKEPSLGMSVYGYYDSRQPDQQNSRIDIQDVNFCGDYEQLIKDAKDDKIDTVYITLPMQAEKRIKHIVDMLADTTLTVYFVPDLFLFDLLRAQWHSLHGIPIISIYDTPFYGIDGVFKRLFDLIVGSLILLIIALPMIIIAILVKLDSRGPALFMQKRYGCNGENIVVWKFRSMTVCQDGADVPQAQRNDPRVTRLGQLLRRTSLDELPQFINVIQGRMSIVGPRPHAVSHNEFYRGQIKGYMLRHKVKPGITGWAQINGYRGETETLDKMEGRIKYDLEYIRNWSVLLDIKIIFLTLFKGFRGAKAY